MFYKYSKQHLIDVLEKVRTCHCAYSSPGHPASQCDCKYGGQLADSPVSGEAGNGCPELRDTIGVLQTMHETEFQRIINRAYKLNKLPKVTDAQLG